MCRFKWTRRTRFVGLCCKHLCRSVGQGTVVRCIAGLLHVCATGREGRLQSKGIRKILVRPKDSISRLFTRESKQRYRKTMGVVKP